MDELKAKADELGIAIDGRWSDETIQRKIDEALLATAEDKSEGGPKMLAELNAEQREIDKAIGGYDVNRRARRVQKILRAQVT